VKFTTFLKRPGCLLLAAAATASFSGCAIREAPPTQPAAERWNDAPAWEVTHQPESTGDLVRAPAGEGLQLTYVLGGEHGWGQLKKKVSVPTGDKRPITFLIKAQATGELEVKFVDPDGSVWGAKIPLEGAFTDWTRITARLGDLDYLWGGDAVFNGLAEFHIVASGKGKGTVMLNDIGFGSEDLASTFTHDAKQAQPGGPFYVPVSGPRIDPDAELPGIGFRQRRAAVLTPEDPLVLEWLKTLQDVSSPGRQVLPTTEDNELQTFNNSLVAMAFMVKGERERAERILDFYAAATVRTNEDPTLQNFFYKGEARGFFQHVALKDQGGVKAFHTYDACDRWMGDMVWLMFAYKCHEKEYGPGRYDGIMGLIRDLLVSWFKDSPDVPVGGYIQHGWRKGDKYLHEPDGHEEGNIDAYAFFKLLGDEERARKVRTWIEAKCGSNKLPLDLYTWRVLAYDGERAELLNIPDYDLRYRKTLTVNGREVTGPFHSASESVTNIWLDGLGHIACAYEAAGNLERGYFYANQFDALLMDSALGGKKTRTIPYTINREGGFEFDQSKGYISVAAWYLFAKNGFNPMRLRKAAVGSVP
jgi:hypothetical protein